MNIALRVFTEQIAKEDKKIVQRPSPQELQVFNRTLTIDTETTADQYHNLKFGYIEVHENSIRKIRVLFYDSKHLTQKECQTLKRYAEQHHIRLFSLSEFIKFFYLEVYEQQTLCIAYNAKFDISRLMQKYGYARRGGRGGFSFTLTGDRSYPRIRSKRLTDRVHSLQFTKGNPKFNPNNNFRGNFLDVQTLACILTDEKSLSLEKACEFFETAIRKKKAKEHGKVTPAYIRYNILDVKATYQVYCKAMAEFRQYQLSLSPTRAYSAASLGKQALTQCSVQSFVMCNPTFPPELLGKVMSAYYGGRCEVRIRKSPIKVTVLDFFSMYPTVNLLLGLWSFVIADRITYVDDTANVQKLIDNFAPEQLLDKTFWKGLVCLVELQPDGDILPCRGDYDAESDSFNIGLNYIHYNGSLYYFLPDVLADCLLTGKRPKIKSAIRFCPEGIQKTLQQTSIYGISIDPAKENLIQLLVEKRQEIKAGRDRLDKGDSAHKQLDAQQRALKILNSSLCYGINVELHPEGHKEELQVYSNTSYPSFGKYEKPGKYFNPIVGAVITAGARLLLAIAEKYVTDTGEMYAYMDTDSIFVLPHLAEGLREHFRKLNPYTFDGSILEIEEGMEDIWFYGISSKRYCLYPKEGEKITIPDGKKLFYKLHGLGHILNPYGKTTDKGWQKRFWEDILLYHYHPELGEDILEEYNEKLAVSQLSISTPEILKRFERYNRGKPLSQQIKPFNFILVGYGTMHNAKGEIVKPIAAYRENAQEVGDEEFIDYKSGKKYRGREHWKTLREVFLEYINHPESKYDGEIELLRRKRINPEGIIYIGKEANQIELQPLEQSPIFTYPDVGALREYVSHLSPTEARRLGITYRSSLWELRQRVSNGGKLNLNTPLMRKILKRFGNQKRN